MILVCAAVEEELSPLLSILRREDGIWRGSVEGADLAAAPVGIGPVEAALGTMRVLAAVRPEKAVLVGTCGALPGSGLGIGTVAEVTRAVLASADAAAGFAYVPGPMHREARPGFSFGLAGAACATTVAITSDPAHAAAVARVWRCELEHLEAYGFLRAAEEAGVPAACVLAVSNLVGPNAHAEWKAHAAAATAATIEALRRALR